MRRPTSLLFFLLFGAAVARADNGSDFQQTQGQSSQGAWSGSDFSQSGRQAGGSAAGGQNQGSAGQPMPAAVGGREDGGHGTNGQDNGNQRDGGQGGGASDRGGKRDSDAKSPNTRDPSAGYDNSADGPSAMDLEGARLIFPTVVEAYVTKKSPDGYWSYAEKKGGKAQKSWRLVRPSVSEPSIKKKNRSRYSGLVKLRDSRGGRPLTLEFVVDFSGQKWKVVSVKPAASPRQ